MPGDISRDFAASLSKLYGKVEALEKSNRTLLEQVEALSEKLQEKDQQKARQQRSRVTRAAFTQDPDEIKRLKSTTFDVVDQEILRMFEQPEAGPEISINIDAGLLQNMQDGMKDATMPEVMYREEPKKEPYVLSKAYAKDQQRLMEQEVMLKMREQRKRYEQKQNEKQMRENNLLKNLSPLWQTDAD